MDKRLLRYAAGGGAISLLACGLLCMVLGALAGGRLNAVCVPAEALLQYTVPRDEFLRKTLALPGVVFGCAYGLYEALKGRDDPDA